jgi:hypothetical protein
MITKIFGIVELNVKKEPFFSDFKKLLALKPEQIKKINLLLSEKNVFNVIKDDEKINNFAQQLDIKIEDLLDILGVSFFIYKNIKEKDVSEEDLNKDLITLSKEIDIELQNDILQSLKLLFKRKDQFDISEKVKYYKKGVIPSIYGLTSICDIRAIFDDKLNITNYIPMVIARISTKDDVGNEEYISFQFTEKTLKDFKIFIDEGLKKLENVKKDIKSKINIYEEEKDE